MSSLLLTRRGSFRVATTVPTMRARIMLDPEVRGGASLRLRADSGLADRKRVLEVGVRPRDDVHRDQLADAAGGGSAGIGRGLHGGHVAAHDGGHVARADLLQPTSVTLAALTIASAASIMAT